MSSGRQAEISDNGRRIARNTLLLYFRMLLLMVVGLFTSRIVLRTLGVDDYGVYNAVGDVVIGFTFITSSLSAAIMRYMAAGLGNGDSAHLKRVFSTAVLIQIVFALLLVLLVETFGVWFLHNRMQIPDGRMGAAEWVLQCSLGVLVLNLLSVPYNATIIAHEKMGAFAIISLLEGFLKLAVAVLLSFSSFDVLKTYALLMLAVALIVRLLYGVYCTSRFEESRGRVVFDRSLIGEMAGFAGWNFFGSSAYVFNTRGVNLLVNVFFGVAVNAARGVASQVEAILKSFASNFLTALNPQITKSWASGDRDYCFSLVRKGAKYTFWMLLLLYIPIFIWTEPLLHLWLGKVPEYAALFTRLILLGLLVDMVGNSIVTLVQATGNVRRYYILTGLSSYLCLPLIWLAFKIGLGPSWAYICFIAVYLFVFVLKLVIVHRQTDFPLGSFFKEFFVLTDGEKAFLFRKFGRYLPDRIYLSKRYEQVIGRKPDLNSPVLFTEKIQWLKLHDRNPLYHTLADKYDVKEYVASIIGSEHVIKTVGVWDSAVDIDWDSLPDQFVLKCTHDSASVIICKDKLSFDRDAAVNRLESALRSDFYKGRDREWVYKGLKPRIIAETCLPGVPRDYKFFCFSGEPKFFKVDLDRFVNHRANYYTIDGKLLSYSEHHCPNDPDRAVELPVAINEMAEYARILSSGIRFVRVDFYYVDGVVYFGEMTFYPDSGFGPLDPPEADAQIGSMISLS